MAAKHFPETTMEYSRVLWWKLAVQGILGLSIVRTRRLDLDYNMHRKQPSISPTERYTSSSNTSSSNPPPIHLPFDPRALTFVIDPMRNCKGESYTPTLTWIGSSLLIATDSKGPYTDEHRRFSRRTFPCTFSLKRHPKGRNKSPEFVAPLARGRLGAC